MPPATTLDERFEQACAKGEIPHAVLLATNASGTFRYEKTFGVHDIADPARTPIAPTAIMWIASCTKLMTTLAALQCVSRGQVKLDEPVAPLLPELAAPDIITSIDDATGAPVLRKSTTPMTLRHLLTHTSGLAYDIMSGRVAAWRRSRGEPVGPKLGSVVERFATPVVFEPGTGFAYGPSIDWAGKLVERANGGQDLEAYLQANVWGPLGVRDMTFDLGRRPELGARLAGTAERGPDGRLGVNDLGDMMYTGATELMGGHGIFAPATEYIKVLRAVLARDARLGIGAELWAEAFSPQLGEGSRAALGQQLGDEQLNRIFAGTPGDPTRKDWGLGGLLTLDAVEGDDVGLLGGPVEGRRPLTMSWGGLPNLVWWVDPTAGLAGIYAAQVTPPGDKVCSDLNRVFETDVYRVYGAWREERYEGREEKL
ncbi:uncharacterized protein K452DRAFT_329444 [Aplosporella prunicola CBS 121167]|uniref:Beta-lactamase-related domain-containing protein n=1 Tax=Aplosporella prunicola CBS 121167 TaxID=1176127 RepID=A0A6A6B190_9PEZI|nr:uncharacterized protein K452DRAFT_329444 [Aplosporella prunicola CBS 121167]KAF2137025.1 hypothetical protein K452DRAFT_329444 [Aplosporella prunicola CBS 121167]